MKFTLIRHSKTHVEPETPIVLWGLSEDGIEKAQHLAGQQSIRRLDAIYSSLQTKAIETMLYLAKPNALAMHTDSRLTEITSFTNKFYAGEQYTQQIADFYSGKLDRIAEGETIKEALHRFESALDEITSENQNAQNIGIVTHGYVLSFFTGKHSDLDPYELHHAIQQPDTAQFDWNTKTFTSLWGAH